jgi:8-oxo-dGTP pyrophosphatase MutT (NUDIX family)
MDALYTAGFLFHRGWVLLVQKHKPDWQAGLLNAIGGKMEVGEEAAAAHNREFWEETGLGHYSWRLFCVESGPGYQVHFFSHDVSELERSPEVPKQNDVDERLSWLPVTTVGGPGLAVVGNLHWLIPLALDPRKLVVEIKTSGRIAERPMWSRDGA